MRPLGGKKRIAGKPARIPPKAGLPVFVPRQARDYGGQAASLAGQGFALNLKLQISDPQIFLCAVCEFAAKVEFRGLMLGLKRRADFCNIKL